MPGRNGLISTAELADILGQADLRLFDCTTYLEPAPEGSSLPYLAVPGRHTFEAGHIPGADFLDLQGEFSDASTELRFMMPDVAYLERAFSRHGVSNESQVVLYSIGTPMWATRFWWMLRIFRRQAPNAGRHLRAGHRRRQRPRPAIPQRVRAQPLRPARPRSRQL